MGKLTSYGKFALQVVVICVIVVTAIILIAKDFQDKGVAFTAGAMLLAAIAGAVASISRPSSEDLEIAKYQGLSAVSGVKPAPRTKKKKSFLEDIISDFDETKAKLEKGKENLVKKVEQRTEQVKNEVESKKEDLNDKKEKLENSSQPEETGNDSFTIQIHAPHPPGEQV